MVDNAIVHAAPTSDRLCEQGLVGGDGLGRSQRRVAAECGAPLLERAVVAQLALARAEVAGGARTLDRRPHRGGAGGDELHRLRRRHRLDRLARREVHQPDLGGALAEHGLAQERVEVHAGEALLFVVARRRSTGLVVGDDQLAVGVEFEPVDDAAQGEAPTSASIHNSSPISRTVVGSSIAKYLSISAWQSRSNCLGGRRRRDAGRRSRGGCGTRRAPSPCRRPSASGVRSAAGRTKSNSNARCTMVPLVVAGRAARAASRCWRTGTASGTT